MNALSLVVCVAVALCEALAAPGGLYGGGGYHGPVAIPHVLPDGHLADTHEVAAAKAEHFNAVAKASSHGGYAGSYGHSAGAYTGGDYGSHGDFRYKGPIAVPHVLHDGHIADTHEVAAAKAEHYAAIAKAKATTGGGGGDYHGEYEGDRYAGGYNSQGGFSGAYHGGAGYHGAYHGPLAKPVVLPNGFLADTHEVAAAKGHHLQVLAQASHYAGPHDHYSH